MENYKTLHHISRSIAEYYEENRYSPKLYYVRYNAKAIDEESIEYNTIKPKDIKYSNEIFKTSAGEINLYDAGEFGGYLKIGEKIDVEGCAKHSNPKA